ncbi:MAG: 50S ribosome-binding GTPase [Chloroflexi bacterium]|nr:50S ribosome-binding GTPase [Chloroflexota bacterium]
MELPACIEALEQAIDAAGRLGLDTSNAAATRRTIAERSGFPGDVYVLALCGGTGVGKSSLLNAVAGSVVSRAGARRPTTAEPVAWVGEDQERQTRPLIEWLGGAHVETHHDADLDGVAILDLPDLDSIAPEHRARVDAVLPKVDAVLWVSDPEKYQDAVLHDGYLRAWVRRLGRQAMVLNKVDRVPSDDAERLRRDLADGLEREGLPRLPVLLTSALGEIGELRTWLAEGVEAKRVVSGRLAADAAARIADLCTQAGLDPRAGVVEPLLSETRRAAAADEVLREVLRVVDLDGLGRQAVEATRLAARPRGGGPLGLVRTILERGSGRSERRAEPAGYLRRWRDRGSLVRAVAPIRDLVAEALPRLPAGARPGIAPLSDTRELTQRLGAAVDRAVAAEPARFHAPTSRLWPLLGLAQYAATAALVVGIIWLVALFAGVGRAETPLLEVPFLGPVPSPVVLVAGGLFASFLINRVLLAHASWLGRRWAAGLRDRVADDVRRLVADAGLRPLAAFESARLGLAAAAAQASTRCQPTSLEESSDLDRA